MTDYAPIIRPYLEFNITKMCNLKCLGCSRDSAFFEKDHANFENYQKDLRALSGVLWVNKFRILGGEPLLSGDLIRYLDVARESGMFGEVGFCTNGILLRKQPDELFRHTDYVDVSIYPGVDYDKVKKTLVRQQTMNPKLKFTLKRIDSFTLTNLNYDNDLEKTLQVYRECHMAHFWSCHTFEDGYYYKCGKPLIQEHYDKARGIDRHYRHGGIPIHEPELQKRLWDYISDPNPLDHCRSCLGTSGPEYKHRQMADFREGLEFT